MSNKNILLQPNTYVKKGWGSETWICNFPLYCGKILILNKGKKCSWHFHRVKDEVLFIESGEIRFLYGWEDDIKFAEEIVLTEGMSFHVPPGLKHQMHAKEDSKIIEFSTHHKESDSIKLISGD